VADSENRRVRLVGTDGTITTVAGNGASPAACGVEAQAGVSPPTSAPLGTVEDVALQGGRIWVVVPHRVLTFDLGGTVAAFFATQCAGALNNPKSLAFDPVGGEVYVSNQSIIGIRRITAAGASAGQYVGRHTLGLAVAPDGTIYLGEAFANTGASSVRRCTVPCSTTVVVAGNGQGYSSGDGGPATSAQLGTDVTDAGGSQLARGPAGVYVAEPQNQRVRLVAADGTISTVAGTGTRGFSGSGGPAVGARLDGPRGVAVDAAGNLLVADSNNHRIRRVLAATGVIEDVAGTGTAGSTDSATATSATLNAPSALAVAADGSVYVADTGGHRIRRFTVGGAMTTVAGTGTAGAGGDGGPATAAQLSSPSGLALAADGTLLVADTGNHRVRSLSPGGTLSTLAGSGTPGFQGDHGPAVTARLTGPTAVAVTPAGVVLVADTGNHRVREVSTSGTITTRAGTGSAAYGGDGLAPRGADLLRPSGLALHPSGDLLVADLGNRRVRRAG
jgi:sugar lactone lactonase YvrE